jgi:hypothetical protein
MGGFDSPAGGMGMGAAPAAAAGGAGDGVFANTGATWGNRYVPSVGNAIGSSDILVKMIIDAPEQQVRLTPHFSNLRKLSICNSCRFAF